MTKKMRQAALLLAEGCDLTRTAQALGVTEDKVAVWMHHPEVMTCFRDALTRRQIISYAKAARLMDHMLSSKDPMTAQKAAHEILDRFAGAVQGEEARSVTVRLLDAPALGMPEA